HRRAHALGARGRSQLRARTGVTPDVRWYESVPSTMDVAAALAAEGAPDGVVVAAQQQTAGRGRRGATWQSPPGAGLYFSIIVRPTFAKATVGKPGPHAASTSPAPLSLITLAAGVGVRDGISAATGLAADLKWPNDLLVNRRKLSGILAEGHAVGTAAQAVVIGIGINLEPAAYPPEVSARATSLAGELGRAIDRDSVFAVILRALCDRLAAIDGKPGDILQAWRAASPSAVGTRVEWEGHRGVTAGIDDSGALLVKTSTGVERIIAGDIHWNL
ncbi:MAG: biotin--[acetyl-CoA-carboxylase] ligase, partial [Vicinamibacterales bacterium]